MNPNERNSPNSNGNKEIAKNTEEKNHSRYVTHSQGHIDNFDVCLIGKNIKITLLNGTSIQGQLRFYGMYDVVITTQNQFRTMTTTKDIIIMKSAIITVEVL